MLFRGSYYNRASTTVFAVSIAYILLYHKLRQEQLTESLSTTDLDIAADSLVNVEKLLKRFKTHRCAMDFDSTFCKAAFCDDNRHDSNGENGSGAGGAST
jgi:hypothetical protein